MNRLSARRRLARQLNAFESLEPRRLLSGLPFAHDGSDLPRYLTDAEREYLKTHPLNEPGLAAPSAPPTGPIDPIAEYEPMEGLVISWTAQTAILTQMTKRVTDAGGRMYINVLSQATGQLESRELKCEGTVDVEIGDRKVEAIRWREKGQEGKPGGHVKNTYWVSSAGHLLKYVGAGGVEYVLESK